MDHPIVSLKHVSKVSALIYFLLIFAVHNTLAGPGPVSSINSPNKQLSFTLKLMNGIPAYSIRFAGKDVISTSSLGLSIMGDSSFCKNFEGYSFTKKTVHEEYKLITGKASSVTTVYNEGSFVFKNKAGNELEIVVRVFDDGIAFRYNLLSAGKNEQVEITNENSFFNVAGNPTVKTLLFADNHSSHEGLYKNLQYEALPTDKLMDMPALFTFPKFYVAVTEASLHDYPGMYLIKKNGMLCSYLSPLPGNETIKAKITLPHKTPWRVLMISENPGDFIKSNLLTSLNEPPETQDWSWLKPGKTAFHWWNGDVVPDTNFAPGLNFETIKYYTDFCADNHIEYNSVIGMGGFAWYSNDGPSYAVPGDYADLTKPASGLDMQKVCDYAKSKGVNMHVWVNWKALYPQLEEAFTQFEKWGVKGMMVDFLDRDDQEMVNIQEDILQKAAAHHLFIQFHGAYKATGMNRTYPNELTREGTLNYEHNKWQEEPVTAGHDLDIIFTRMLGGATDYHLGGFRAVVPDSFKTHFVKPLMGGTRAHMLGMYVVLESYLSMVADYPDAYKNQPGFDFLQKVPTVWDQTEVPAAVVNEYVCIARRKGADWYLGAINNNEERGLKIPLDFLNAGAMYEVEIFQDAEDVKKDPNHLLISKRKVTSMDFLNLRLAGSGGMAAIIKKL